LKLADEPGVVLEQPSVTPVTRLRSHRRVPARQAFARLHRSRMERHHFEDVLAQVPHEPPMDIY
jgi:hypothetical protein